MKGLFFNGMVMNGRGSYSEYARVCENVMICLTFVICNHGVIMDKLGDITI